METGRLPGAMATANLIIQLSRTHQGPPVRGGSGTGEWTRIRIVIAALNAIHLMELPPSMDE